MQVYESLMVSVRHDGKLSGQSVFSVLENLTQPKKQAEQVKSSQYNVEEFTDHLVQLLEAELKDSIQLREELLKQQHEVKEQPNEKPIDDPCQSTNKKDVMLSTEVSNPPSGEVVVQCGQTTTFDVLVGTEDEENCEDWEMKFVILKKEKEDIEVKLREALENANKLESKNLELLEADKQLLIQHQSLLKDKKKDDKRFKQKITTLQEQLKIERSHLSDAKARELQNNSKSSASIKTLELNLKRVQATLQAKQTQLLERNTLAQTLIKEKEDITKREKQDSEKTHKLEQQLQAQKTRSETLQTQNQKLKHDVGEIQKCRTELAAKNAQHQQQMKKLLEISSRSSKFTEIITKMYDHAIEKLNVTDLIERERVSNFIHYRIIKEVQKVSQNYCSQRSHFDQ